MAAVRNAFKIRSADAPSLGTAQFLQLYSPLMLEQLRYEDLFVPKLVVVRGSPGSGKSSLLRLFETDTLVAANARRGQAADRGLVERFVELGALDESGPTAAGIYIQCDSSLRDIANLPSNYPLLKLLNALLDARVVGLYLRAAEAVIRARGGELRRDTELIPLSAEESPPPLLSRPQTVAELKERCAEVERNFGALLNSFPDEPLPTSIYPHARVYSISFLALQREKNPVFKTFLPIVMLDDVQELYPDQRKHLRSEFIRRAAVPRWLAVRTQVYGLEDLISIEGLEQGRDVTSIPLDEVFQEKPSLFPKFAANVIHRRLQQTDSLQQVSVDEFKSLLQSPPDDVGSEAAGRALEAMADRIAAFPRGAEFRERFKKSSEGSSDARVSFQDVVNKVREMILFVRLVNRSQLSLLPELDLPETTDSRTTEAAVLFASREIKRPYYSGFEVLADLASGNVEQLLSTTSEIVDRMIYRAELDRLKNISAGEQEEIFETCSESYFQALEEKHRRGSAIRQLVENLGAYFESVTYRPNAPIAPGVNGFGLTRAELEKVAGPDLHTRDAQILREVLTNSVAGNVFSVRPTKQGQSGALKVVFYLNRLLCVRYRLPLGFGGWQHIPVDALIRLMKEPVPVKDIRRRGISQDSNLWEEEADS